MSASTAHTEPHAMVTDGQAAELVQWLDTATEAIHDALSGDQRDPCVPDIDTSGVLLALNAIQKTRAVLVTLGEEARDETPGACRGADRRSPTPTPPARAEPGDADTMALDLHDRMNLRTALDTLERGIVELAGVRHQDAEALQRVADASKVFRYELRLHEVRPDTES